ncbi:MAG: AAA family ATPase, partial [Bacillota bacterium]
MKKELILGAALGGLLFLIYQGVNVLPALAGLGLFYMLFSTTNLRNMGKGFATVSAQASSTVPQIKFDDIGGQSTAKQELLEALDFLRKGDKMKALGIRPLKGILLIGPPGTGKTLLAKAAATYTDSIFMGASGSDFVEMYAGVGAQRVRKLFEQAKDSARREKRGSAIVFIDEFEVLGARRGANSSHMEYDQTLNALLVEMDGLTQDEDVRVLVMAATNRVDMLDPAITRPGRFDRIVKVDLPDKEGRLAILQLHVR